MSKWKHFTKEECVGVLDDVMFKLDRARELFGYPIVITSGFRTPEHNEEIGGTKDSEHIFGRAVDIQAPTDPYVREKLCWALGLAGFSRLEICKRHFHVDVSKTKPSPCFWEGTDH
jgi:hypothetical protein